MIARDEEGRPQPRGAREKPRWLHVGGTDRGWMFCCEDCNGLAYYPQRTRGNGRDALVCPYLYCPNCGTEMGGVYKAKHARADA